MSRRTGKIAFTLLGQRNTHTYFDADKDGFTDLPKLTKYNLNPKLFFYFTDKSKLTLGGTFTNEIKQGGDIYLLNNQYADTNHFYKEQNDVKRVTTQLKFDHKLNEKSSLTVRNSFNNFQRALEITPSKALQQYRFSGQQLSTFSEVAYTFRQKKIY